MKYYAYAMCLAVCGAADAHHGPGQFDRSQPMAHSKPPPTAHPRIAPTMILSLNSIVRVTRCIVAISAFASRSPAGCRYSWRSAPAQNARPAPVKTMARVRASSLAAANASAVA